ncbi:MAG TPA: ATP-dependent DNA ligase [Pirellulaceae bacterium]|jgi:DNA ligase-1|nr:ATP-dependent DNA ligase [Pirellulaceae bacterium]
MERFSRLYRDLDSTTKTNAKVDALKAYFAEAPPEDAAWAIYFLSGRKIKRVLPTRDLVDRCLRATDLPYWLFEESYAAVGDLAETIALLLPFEERTSDRPLHEWVEDEISVLRHLDEAARGEAIERAWRAMDRSQRFVWNKLLTGEFRVGVSQRLVTRALAESAGLDIADVAHRMMGPWEPTPSFYKRLLSEDSGDVEISRPYPFCLAHPLQEEPETLGGVKDWLAEWKWDGIRAQAIHRRGEIFLWSRGEEPVLEQFPELAADLQRLPIGTVLDGEALAWKDDAALPFGTLQRRLGRKSVGKKLLAEAPMAFLAFDLLEYDGEDWRQRPLRERRAKLEELLAAQTFERFRLSPVAVGESWDALAELRRESRERRTEGLMLKRLDGPYGVGRTTGLWWKWKIDPYTIDAVLLYGQKGHGRRANLFTDYTFGVWENHQLVPFAKAYSGLTDAEIREVDKFIRQNTLEKFGPVRSVKPELVFELGFENIQRSTRHKSGIAVRFPRILRWRKDKSPDQADFLDTVKSMLPEGTGASQAEAPGDEG